jgi:hypothetical protein
MTTGPGDGVQDAPAQPAAPARRGTRAVARPPRAARPAGRLPAGSAPAGSTPAVGWQGPVGARLPDRTARGEREQAAAERAVAEAVPSDRTGEWEMAPRPAPRQPVLVQGALPAALALLLAGAAALGTVPLALLVLGVQVVLLLAFLALVDAPASGGAFLVALGAVVAADVAVVVFDGDIRALAGVVALALIASLLHQLVRPTRSRVTESMADTLVVVVLGVSASCLVSLRALDGGDETVRVALVAAGASLLAGRVGDRLANRPMLAVGSTRGWPGLLLGLGTGVAAAVLVAGDGGDAGVVVGTQAALLGLVCGATVAAADLTVDLGAAELRAGRRDARRVEALKPANLLLPFAFLGPIALVAGHLVLG